MAVVLFDCLIPEKMKQAFSIAVESEEEEDAYSETGYLNSVFLEEGPVSVITLVSG
jgi:hypothetical protein